MIVDLRCLEQASAEIEGEIPADDPLWEDSGVELATPLAVQVTADGSSARGVWVRGSFIGRIRSRCRRCLEQVEIEVAEELAVYFDPDASATDEDVTLYALDPQADELDLRPSLKERLVLALPAYPVCREVCRGLCPHCGAKLNEGECGCDAAESDPRWGPLQGLHSED